MRSNRWHDKPPGWAGSGFGLAASIPSAFSLSTVFEATNDANLSDVVPQDDFERATVFEFRRGVEQGEDSWKMREWAKKQINEHRLRQRDPKPKPKPVPPILPNGNVRVDEDENRRCKLLIICFLPTKPTINQSEFERQMELQERGLNAMTPQAMLANRARYIANPVGMRALSSPLQGQAHNEYSNSRRVRQQYVRKYGPIQGPIELENYLGNAAALHNPDMVAGGAYDSVTNQQLPIEDRIEGLPENSSMGSQWIDPKRNGNTRATRLEQHARRQAQNNCPSVRVDMKICQSDKDFPGKPITGT